LTLGDALEEVAALSLKRFDEDKKEAQVMMVVVLNRFATVGPTVAIDARLEAPTLWGTTAFIAEDVVELGSVVSSLESMFKIILEAIQLIRMSHEARAINIATKSSQECQSPGFRDEICGLGGCGTDEPECGHKGS
jgi:hypothetical protein